MSEHVVDILKGATVAPAGAGLTYLGQLAAGGEGRQWAPLVTAALSVVSAVVAKWAGQTQTVKFLMGRK
jgi:hypothetical protein